ncbi:hypothetical protein O3P69_000145 [Scylla paramamosain]|uniref:Secreted protein n=1 Tax=Scylla paramamosain TaxID=85552 RepID=A0AAW0UUT2_SCYPA
MPPRCPGCFLLVNAPAAHTTRPVTTTLMNPASDSSRQSGLGFHTTRRTSQTLPVSFRSDSPSSSSSIPEAP